MLYINNDIEHLNVEQALQLVGDARRNYALRYRNELHRRLSLAAALLLRQALNEHYGISNMPRWDFGAHGKPFLPDYPHIHFNLSHCDCAAVCVVDSQPVGVDVECINRYDPLLVERTMNEKEQKEIRTSSSSAEAFITLWTMKEALLKLTGEGISADLHHTLADKDNFSFQSIKQNGYIITVARQLTIP